MFAFGFLCLLFKLLYVATFRFESNYFTCIKLTPVGCRTPTPLLLHINRIKANTELHLETLNTVIKVSAGVGGFCCDAVDRGCEVVMDSESGVERFAKHCIDQKKHMKPLKSSSKCFYGPHPAHALFTHFCKKKLKQTAVIACADSWLFLHHTTEVLQNCLEVLYKGYICL